MDSKAINVLMLFIWQTGSERAADSVRKKIDQLISSYRKTSDWIDNTGEGIRSNESDLRKRN